jgi:quercetin dioxygenase-like cupin family protein
MRSSIITTAVAVSTIGASSALADTIEIRRPGEMAPVVGAPNNFTGHAVINPLFPPNDNTRANIGLVDFAPNARTTWHTHPAGQLLIVTKGQGWIQEEGKERRTIEVGDVVWIPAGVKHWHGGTDKTAMSHIALTYVVNGKNVEWLEPVSDDQYR